MKTHELLEAKALPDWVKEEDDAFRALAKRYGLAHRKKPVQVKDRWTFGGELKDVEKGELALRLGKRVAAMQKAVAKHLHDHKERGREVVTYDIRWLGQFPPGGYWKGAYHQLQDAVPKTIYPDDTLAYIENRVSDKLYINNSSAGGYTIIFQYGLDEPKVEKPAEEPPKPRQLRVVKASK